MIFTESFIHETDKNDGANFVHCMMVRRSVMNNNTGESGIADTDFIMRIDEFFIHIQSRDAIKGENGGQEETERVRGGRQKHLCTKFNEAIPSFFLIERDEHLEEEPNDVKTCM